MSSLYVVLLKPNSFTMSSISCSELAPLPLGTLSSVVMAVFKPPANCRGNTTGELWISEDLEEMVFSLYSVFKCSGLTEAPVEEAVCVAGVSVMQVMSFLFEICEGGRFPAELVALGGLPDPE